MTLSAAIAVLKIAMFVIAAVVMTATLVVKQGFLTYCLFVIFQNEFIRMVEDFLQWLKISILMTDVYTINL